MNMYRLDTALDFVGGFWPPANPTQVTTGRLSTEEGQLYFLESPTAKKLNDNELIEAFSAFGAYSGLQQVDALCGQTKNGRCTLLHLIENDDVGVLDGESRMQINAARWRVSAAVMGLHLDSSQAESLDGAAFYFTKIHKWLPQAGSLQFTEEGISYLSPSKALQVFQFDSVSLEAKVICEVFSRKMQSVPRIRIIPDKPQSLDWFVSIGPRLENFFTLFLGTSVSLKKVQLFQGDTNDGWLIQKKRARREKINPASWVRSDSREMSEALSKWLTVPEEQRPVEKTVLGMVRQSSLFVETEFLALAQALEGFGRLHFEGGPLSKTDFKAGLAKLREVLFGLWGEHSEITKRCYDALGTANEASFGQRIEKTYNLLSAEFGIKLLGEKLDFVSKVKQTRNYFTHLGIQKGTYVIRDSKELFLLNQRLHALLRCVMLIDLGISEDKLRAPILHQATRWK